MNTIETGLRLSLLGVWMKLKALKNRKAYMDRNLKGPVLYVAYNRRLKKYYVGVTSKSFNERYSRRDYKHHFSNAFYCDPTAFDIYIYKFKSLANAYKLESKLVTWVEAKSSKYYNKIPGGFNG